MDGPVRALAASNYALFAGGEFHEAGGVPVNHLAWWFDAAWDSLGAGTDSTVLALHVFGSDHVLAVGGAFSSAGGRPSNRSIARCWVLVSDDVPPDSVAYWDSLGIGMNGDVLALASFSAADLIAGGNFTTADLIGAHRVAKWSEYPSGTEEPAVPSGLTDLRVAPNPTTVATTVSYFLPGPARVRLEVFSASGARVRRLVDLAQPAGEHSITWNRMADSGRPLPRGVYFVRLAVGSRTTTGKMVLLR
jgi:hypothetical protein